MTPETEKRGEKSICADPFVTCENGFVCPHHMIEALLEFFKSIENADTLSGAKGFARQAIDFVDSPQSESKPGKR